MHKNQHYLELESACHSLYTLSPSIALRLPCRCVVFYILLDSNPVMSCRLSIACEALVTVVLKLSS